jgi:hypothetical protein
MRPGTDRHRAWSDRQAALAAGLRELRPDLVAFQVVLPLLWWQPQPWEGTPGAHLQQYLQWLLGLQYGKCDSKFGLGVGLTFFGLGSGR